MRLVILDPSGEPLGEADAGDPTPMILDGLPGMEFSYVDVDITASGRAEWALILHEGLPWHASSLDLTPNNRVYSGGTLTIIRISFTFPVCGRSDRLPEDRALPPSPKRGLLKRAAGLLTAGGA